MTRPSALPGQPIGRPRRPNVMTRMMLALGLAISVLILAPSQAFACSCAMFDLVAKADLADQVVTGTVRSVHENSTTSDFEVTVDGNYKGELTPVLTVSTANQGAACGLNLVSDERYLLFLKANGDKLTTNSCLSTPMTDELEPQVVAALGQPRVLKAPTATPTTAVTDDPPRGNVSAETPASSDNSSTLRFVIVGAGLAVTAALALLFHRRRNRLT